MKKSALVLATLMTLVTPVWAEEGMWTFNNFPSQKVAKQYGFAPTQGWLDHVRLSSVRLAGGCSASFISPNGLIMTNHHCMSGCIQQVSTPTQDYIKNGFYAKTRAEEIKCPAVELNVLLGITDVTQQVNQATQGLSDQKFNEAQKAEFSKIEKTCSENDKFRCDVVTLYQGGIYNLYKYKRYEDARLVFAPEFQIAFFGGDPDNFNFPRYDLDLTLIRAYENDQPVQPTDYLAWSPEGAAENELVFVSGHPGSTQRLLTVAQLEFLRDIEFPARLLSTAELRGVLTQFAKEDPERKRISQGQLFGIENNFKALKGRHQTLLDPSFFAQKVAAEQTLRQAIAQNPAQQKRYGKAWDEIATAQARYKLIYKPYSFVEGGSAFNSRLFRIARTLVRGSVERKLPNEKRLREFTDAALASVTQGLFSKAPIYPDLEETTLAYSLGKLREALGSDDPLVRRILGKESPEDLARTLVRGSKLADVALRKQLWDGDPLSVKDPMILLAKLIDDDARALRQRYETEVEGPIKKNSELIAKARFATQGTSTYPDATFTLRLSYGSIKGYVEDGRLVKPFTQIGGAFERATGKDPFALPLSWLAAQNKLKLGTPMNFVATTDIIGGNSGSPLINRRGEVVGLAFDGNIQSLGGAFGFDATVNRTVSVHSAAILETLRTVYGADPLVQELTIR